MKNPLLEILDSLTKDWPRTPKKKGCWFHDYEIVEIYRSTSVFCRFEPNGVKSERMVCLKCGKVIDDTLYYKRIDANANIEHEDRQKRALEILKHDKK
jgi:hypothetical protein